MKKKLAAALLLLTLVLGLTGCGKSTIEIVPQDLGDYEVVEYSSDLASYSKDGQTITVTVDKNGDYDFVVKDEDGNEHSFTLVYKDKSAEIKSDEELSINLGIK